MNAHQSLIYALWFASFMGFIVLTFLGWLGYLMAADVMKAFKRWRKARNRFEYRVGHAFRNRLS